MGTVMAPELRTMGPIGLILPTFAQESVPTWARPTRDLAENDDPLAELAAMCRGAEALGADALWACDHLFWHRPCLECTVVLSVAAMATERVVLGSCVIQLPLRQSSVVAKQAASLQTLSRGRMVLGVGVGSHPGEYEQVGVDYHQRGADLDRAIDELRRSWASGEGVSLGDVNDSGAARYRQLPAPEAVPVYVGGSSEAALRRAARLGDGWMPLFLSVDEYRSAAGRLSEEVRHAGREPDEVARTMVLFVSVDDDPAVAQHKGTAWMSSLYGIPAKAFNRHLVAGTAEDVTGAIADYRAAGADHVVLYVTADEPLGQFEQISAALANAGRNA